MFHCLCTVVCLVYSIREITSSMQAVSFISTKLKVTNNRDTDSEIKSHHFIRKHTFTHIRLSEPSHIMCRTSSDVKLLPRVSAAFLQKYEAVKKRKKKKQKQDHAQRDLPADAQNHSSSVVSLGLIMRSEAPCSFLLVSFVVMEFLR